MGYDITYHLVNEEQLHDWFFNPLLSAKQGDMQPAKALAKKYELKELIQEEYADVIERTANHTLDETEVFEDSFGFSMVIIAGFFSKFYYFRNSSLSFLCDDHPEFLAYTTSLKEIVPSWLEAPIHDEIVANYSCGKFINPQGVVQLLEDYETKPSVKEKLDEVFGPFIGIFLRALNEAKENQVGMLEATDNVVPVPMDPMSSQSHTDLYNCDEEIFWSYVQHASDMVARMVEEYERKEQQ